MGILEVIKGDITQLKVDAIVNANNTQLISHAGKGVNGAIVEAAGHQIVEEIKKIMVKYGEIEPGKAVLTSGGNLPSKYVIHTVGPVWQGGGQKEEVILTDCYENCLRVGVEYQAKTIAFPNISTGSYLFPKQIAAEIAVGTILWFLRQEQGASLEKVYLVCHNNENYELCKSELTKQQAVK